MIAIRSCGCVDSARSTTCTHWSCRNGSAARVSSGVVPDTMLLLEHPRVYTRGRRSAPGELSLSDDFYRSQGIEIVEVNRGGKITYHGPGQLVGYPIVAVDDVVEYVRTLERALVAALAAVGVAARARPEDGPDFTGVWIQNRKIASIGVHVQRGVTTHGFAINLDNDLTPFQWVVACGLPDVTMTSLALETGRDDSLLAVLLPACRVGTGAPSSAAGSVWISRAELDDALLDDARLTLISDR